MGSLEDDLTEYHRMHKHDEEIKALRKRIAELEALGKRMSLAADSNGLGWMPLFEEARAAFVKTSHVHENVPNKISKPRSDSVP